MGLLYRTGLIRPRRSLANHLTIVTFHRVLPVSERSNYPLPGLAVTPERFEWLLRLLTRSYECAPLAEAARGWIAGEPVVRPRLAITFDDALGDNFRHAAPVLARFGLRASYFVPVEAVEHGELLWHDRMAWALSGSIAARPAEVKRLVEALDLSEAAVQLGPHASRIELLVQGAKRLTAEERALLIAGLEGLHGGRPWPAWEGMMNWEQLRELRRQGHEIGSHSLSHPLLPQCVDDDELAREIGRSKRLLEERLDGAVESFCYPNGDWDERVRRWVEKEGYRWAVTTREGLNSPGADPLTLRRCDMVDSNLVRHDGQPSEARAAWRVSRLRSRLT